MFVQWIDAFYVCQYLHNPRLRTPDNINGDHQSLDATFPRLAWPGLARNPRGCIQENTIINIGQCQQRVSAWHGDIYFTQVFSLSLIPDKSPSAKSGAPGIPG